MKMQLTAEKSALPWMPVHNLPHLAATMMMKYLLEKTTK